MKKHFLLTYLLLLVLQVIICNTLHLTQYLYLSILPVMILCLPLRVSTVTALFVAFGSGLAVDLLADGLIGLNAAALVPLAMLRKSVIRRVFGDEVFARKEDISLKKNGIQKMTVAIILMQAVFMAIYVWADGAGTRPFWFNATKVVVSIIAGSVVSLALSDLLSEESGSRWS